MQHDYILSDAPGASVRADINNALGSIVTQNSGATAPTTTYAYMTWADTTTGLLKIRDSSNASWIIVGELGAAYLGIVAGVQATIQDGSENYLGSLSGTNTLTATASPTLTTQMATGSRWTALAAAANTGATTINIDAQGAVAVVRPDGSALQAGDIPAASYPCRFLKRAADVVLLNPATAATQNQNANSTAFASTAYVDRANQISVRQTVKFGPVDANGFSDFGGATGSTTVTATGTIYLTASYGMMDLIGSITNPAWTGLSTNGTMYLYVDIAADGTCTTGVGTLAPVYQEGGTYSTTNGQFTFNIQEMTGKVGNGATAAQTYRVYVGEVTVAGGAVTAIVWYALNRRSYHTQASLALATVYSFNHNLGLSTAQVSGYFICTTADAGCSIGDRIPIEQMGAATGSGYGASLRLRKNSAQLMTDGTSIGIVPGSGTTVGMTPGSWSAEITVCGTW